MHSKEKIFEVDYDQLRNCKIDRIGSGRREIYGKYGVSIIFMTNYNHKLLNMA